MYSLQTSFDLGTGWIITLLSSSAEARTQGSMQGKVKGRGGLDSHGIIFGSLLRCLFSGNCPIFAFLSAPDGRHWREDVSLTHVMVYPTVLKTN